MMRRPFSGPPPLQIGRPKRKKKKKNKNKKLGANSSTNYNLETATRYVCLSTGWRNKTLPVTPKEHPKKSFEKSLERILKLQVNRKRAYIFRNKEEQ
jgi:hypothetical protein